MNKYLNRGAETRLSRLPKLNRTATVQATICAVCADTIETGNDYLNRVEICRNCLGVYSKIDALLDAAAIEKTRREKLTLWGQA